MKLFLYTILICNLIYSCSFNSSKNKIASIIKKWENKEIIFPPQLISNFEKQDSTFTLMLNKQYKILHFIDSTGCTPCKLTLFEWNQLLKEFPNKNKMAFIFIISTKDSVTIAKTNQWKHLHKFIYPIFYDIKNTFNDMNKFNDDPMFQTFLLDKNNKILLIGNPIYNAEIKTLYQNILNK